MFNVVFLLFLKMKLKIILFFSFNLEIHLHVCVLNNTNRTQTISDRNKHLKMYYMCHYDEVGKKITKIQLLVYFIIFEW